ncbi:MAG: TonB-dependent receptor [Opitutae bacterium]|nr:TonB-dependent receptor [Opitutae bacterium]
MPLNPTLPLLASGKLRSTFATALAVFALIVSTAFAQTSATGRISGLVTNQATGDLLPGAIVQIADSALSTTTDRSGMYSLNLPGGTHTLVVSFTGLDTARTTVTVEAGKTLVKDFALNSEVYQMEAFVTKGTREGNALAIQLQRQAPNAKTVAATDTFGNPAANPGEMLQRLPGITADITGAEVRTVYIRGMAPTFSNLMVDGDKVAVSAGSSGTRDYQIEQMGTANIESIELIKAPTPDMDASAVAGYVNLIPKRAFDLPGRQITATAGTMWKVRKSGVQGPFKDDADNIDLLAFTYSDVFSVNGGRNNLGVSFNLMRRVGATLQDEVGGFFTGGASAFVFNANPANTLQSTVGTGDIGYAAVSHNAGLSVDYKLSSDTVLFARLAFNSNDQYQEYIREQIVATNNINSFETGSTYAYQAVKPVARATIISSIFPKFSRNYQFSTGAEQKLFHGDGKLTFRTNFSFANINYPNYVDARAVTPAATSTAPGIGYTLDRRGRDSWLPAFTQTAGPSISDSASYTPSVYFHQTQQSPNQLFGTRLDYQHNFDAGVPVFIKVGVKYDSDTREPKRDQDNFTWSPTAPTGVTPYVGYRYAQAQGKYGPFPFLQLPGTGKPGDILKAPANSWIKTPTDAYNDIVQSRTPDAKLTEKIQAAYVSGNMQLGKLRVLGGLRVERTETSITSWDRATNSSNSLSTSLSLDENRARALASFKGIGTRQSKYRNVFPGIHFVYEPVSKLLIRASYNKSIARPPVANLLPNYVVNLDAGTISGGNPNLKPFKSDNFEFSVQKYFEPVGLFEIALFQKSITDYFRTIATAVGTGPDNGFDGQYSGFTVNMPLNTGNARIRGIDASYQQQFSFLPGALRGLGMQASFTYQQAEGNFGTTTFQRQLANFSPRSGNLSIFYRRGGLDARILANYRGKTYVSGSGLSSLYRKERVLLDLKLQYTINRTYQLFLDVTNLMDEPTRTDVMENDIRYLAAWNGIGFSAGVKARF